jgi:DNA modification methylase
MSDDSGPLFDAANDNAGAEAVTARAVNPRTAPAVSRRGDVWLIGPHRVFCGDACAPGSVRRTLGALTPNLMVTDPPYGVNYDPSWRLEVSHGARAIGAVANDNRADWRAAFRHFRGCVAYVWHAALMHVAAEAALKSCGFEIRSQIIWNKGCAAFSRGHYHWKHEACIYAVRKGANARWTGGRDQVTVWEAPLLVTDDGRTGHATQKPVGLMQRPILNHTRRGEAVYDPFLGSGSTIIAAASCGRVGVGIEIEPGYVDAAVRRVARFTQTPALLEGDGRAFEAIAEERAA